jgi:hypothetical protein
MCGLLTRVALQRLMVFMLLTVVKKRTESNCLLSCAPLHTTAHYSLLQAAAACAKGLAVDTFAASRTVSC